MSISTCKFVNDPVGNGTTVGVQAWLDTGKILHIPFDPDNIDYQAYLEWAKNNTADPVDELTWDDIRGMRDGILRDTDWTMTTGSTVDQAHGLHIDKI